VKAMLEIEKQADPRGALPAIVSAADFCARPIPEPAQIVHGLLHLGEKAVIGGASKSFKTWNLLDLCLAVATGGPWMEFETARANALYVNLELPEWAVHRRLNVLAEARGHEVPRNLHLWNLRGRARTLTELLIELREQIEGEGYGLIVPDPIYKTLAGRNENGAAEIAEVCGEVETVAVETGAAVGFGAHYAKGNASSKEHIDRMSGSGVWARDPDSIITMTAHEALGCLSVEATLRNFPPVDPFVIRWEYPRFVRASGLDPAKLKPARGGRQAEYSPRDLLSHLAAGMSSTAWQRECREEIGVPERTFYRILRTIEDSGLARKAGRTWILGNGEDK
jgi:hypothetical protein